MKTSLIRLICKAMTEFTPIPNLKPLQGLNRVAIMGVSFASNNRKNTHRKPGKSNDEIATIVSEIWLEAQDLGVETLVIIQREVAESLRKNYPTVPITKILEEVGDEVHISSEDILGQAWETASRAGIVDAILVAHKRHALRCAWNAEMWGFRVRFPGRFAFSYTWKDRPSQTQWHTWNAPIYFLWELLSRAKLVAVDFWRHSSNRMKS